MASSPTISSARNPIIRHVLRLRDNRFRQRDAAVLVDGRREIELAFASGLTLRSLFVAEPLAEETAGIAASAGPLVVSVTPDVLCQIAYGNNPRGAVAVFDRPENRNLEALVLPPDPLVVVMVGIEKPGNAGAIFRSADAVGADAVILCQAGCDLFNPNLIRSSLGTVFTMASAEADQAETLRWLGQQKLHCLAAIVGARQTFWEADYRGPTAIVLGSEAKGLGSLWSPTPHAIQPVASGLGRTVRRDGPGGQLMGGQLMGGQLMGGQLMGGEPRGKLTAVSIPMLGSADSLNVSVTAAALLFEARRQRRGIARHGDSR